MPFKLFHTHKSKQEKSNSFSGSDLTERKCEEPPDCDQKTHHKNILHFFSSSKGNSHVHFKSSHPDKEKKAKSNGILSHAFKTKSLTQLSSNGKDNAHSVDQNICERALPTDSNSCDSLNTAGQNCGPRRVASYGTFMDSLSRERRIMEIAQLDSYMKYLRHTEDEGNMASRLCCAQVLKMSLIRLEQRYLNSQDRIDICHKGSSSNSLLPSVGSNHCNQKPQSSKIVHETNSSSSASPVNKDGHTAFISSTDSHSRESIHNSGSEPDSEDNCRFQENITTLKNGASAVWPRDIEIF